MSCIWPVTIYIFNISHGIWCGAHEYIWGLPWWLRGKRTWQCRRHRFDLWTGKIPWRKTWQPTNALYVQALAYAHAHKYIQQMFKLTCRLETVMGKKSHWMVLQQSGRQSWVQQPSYQTLRKPKAACRPRRRLWTGWLLQPQVWLDESKQMVSRFVLGK